MGHLDSLSAASFWHMLTRLGEAEILLPLLLVALAVLLRTGKRQLAVLWTALLLLGAVLTTASKLAFLGWGLGIAAINFTGISGHTMFSTTIYPMLMVTLLAGESPQRHRLALLAGCALALLIGCSRIAVQAHSWSEVWAGWLLGGALTATLFALGGSGKVLLRPVVPMLLLVWVLVAPASMPASHTHSMVTALALKLSGHAMPFTRHDLLRASALAVPQ